MASETSSREWAGIISVRDFHRAKAGDLMAKAVEDAKKEKPGLDDNSLTFFECEEILCDRPICLWGEGYRGGRKKS